MNPLRSPLAALTLLASAPSLLAADWLQFRGPDGTGVSPEPELPTALSETSIAWKKSLPGRGISSPIILGNKLFLTASSGPEQDRLHVLCLDASTGEKIWERQFWATGRTMTHPKIGVATSSPCSDGKRIFAAFSSNDVVALDLDGNLLWFRGLTRDYPNASNSLGMASSLVFTKNTLVFPVENDSESFTIGLNPDDGSNRWKLDRPKVSNWTTPVLFQNGIALMSNSGVTLVDPDTGKTQWTFEGGGSSMSSLTATKGMLFVPTKGTTALKPATSPAEPETAWQNNQMQSSTVSPVILKDSIYTLNNAGILKRSKAVDGEKSWQLRTTGPYSASPVAAGDFLYLVNEKGLVQTVDTTAPEGNVVSSLDLHDTVIGTPSIGHGALYVRSDSTLYRIGPKKTP
jgi:outer membrane protein assembly factor BamB